MPDASWLARYIQPPQALKPDGNGFVAGMDSLRQAVAQIGMQRLQEQRMAQEQAQFEQQEARLRANAQAQQQHNLALEEHATRKFQQDQQQFGARLGFDQAQEARDIVGKMGEAASAGDAVRMNTLVPAARAIGIEASNPQVEPAMQPAPQELGGQYQLQIPEHLRATGLFQQPEEPQQLQLSPEHEAVVNPPNPAMMQPPPPDMNFDEPEGVALPDVNLGEQTNLPQPDAPAPEVVANQDSELERAKQILMLRLGNTPLGSIDVAPGQQRGMEAVHGAMGALSAMSTSPAEMAIRQRALDAAIALQRGGQAPKDALAFGQGAAEQQLDRNAASERAVTMSGNAAARQAAVDARQDKSEKRITASQAFNEVRQTAKDLNVDNTIKSYQEMEKATATLKANPRSPAAWAAYRTAFSRAYGERGAATEGDVHRAGGMDTRTWMQQLEQLATARLEGGVSPAIARDTLNVASGILDNMSHRLIEAHDALRKNQEYYSPGGQLENDQALAKVDKYITTLFSPLPWGAAAAEEGSPYAKKAASAPKATGPAPARAPHPAVAGTPSFSPGPQAQRQPGDLTPRAAKALEDYQRLLGSEPTDVERNPEIDALLGL